MYRLCPNLMSERFYLEMNYLFTKREHLDLDNPKTFNEKIQWLKIYDRNPLYTLLVDKYLVKEWVAKTIGEEYVIPLIAKYNTPEEIDPEQLPNQFVLKCNHDSGSVIKPLLILKMHDGSYLNALQKTHPPYLDNGHTGMSLVALLQSRTSKMGIMKNLWTINSFVLMVYRK